MMLSVALLPGNPAATIKEFRGMVECLGSVEGGGVGGVALWYGSIRGEPQYCRKALVCFVNLPFMFAEQCLLSILCVSEGLLNSLFC